MPPARTTLPVSIISYLGGDRWLHSSYTVGQPKLHISAQLAVQLSASISYAGRQFRRYIYPGDGSPAPHSSQIAARRHSGSSRSICFCLTANSAQDCRRYSLSGAVRDEFLYYFYTAFCPLIMFRTVLRLGLTPSFLRNRAIGGNHAPAVKSQCQPYQEGF
jgi:hypothetical protein